MNYLDVETYSASRDLILRGFYVENNTELKHLERSVNVSISHNPDSLYDLRGNRANLSQIK